MKTVIALPTTSGTVEFHADSADLSGPLAELTREFLALTPLVEAAKVGTPHEGHDGWSTGAEVPRCGCGELMEWLRGPTT